MESTRRWRTQAGKTTPRTPAETAAKRRRVKRRAAGAALVAVLTVAANEWAGIEAPAPRTPSGRVDLTGLWRGPRALPEIPAEPEGDQINASFTEARGALLFSPLRTQPEQGTSPLTPAARVRLLRRDAARAGRTEADSWTDRNSWERCITRGMPAGTLPEAHADRWLILQTDDTVTIVAETLHETRITRFAERAPAGPRQWLGQRVARWEGDTLAIESAWFRIDPDTAGDADPLRGAHPGPNDALRIVERWTALSHERIAYSVEAADPLTYDRRVVYAYTWRREPEDQALHEDACHEGNRSMANMLRGARANPAESRADNRAKIRERLRRGHPAVAWPATRFIGPAVAGRRAEQR